MPLDIPTRSILLWALLALALPSTVLGEASSDSTRSAMAATVPTLPPPRVAGYLQVRETVEGGVGLTALLNRARFSIDGALPSGFSYRLLTELEASAGRTAPATVSLREAIARWSRAPFTLTAGEFKTPFTREYLIPVPALELAELATAIDSLAPKYDVGVMAEYTYGALAALQIGAFNGEGANTTANRDSAVLVVGRLTARPLAPLALGASATHERGDSLRWAIDASVQQWGATVRAEYLTRHVRGRARANDDFGWSVLESMRILLRVQFVARQEDFQRPLRGTARRLRGLAWGTNGDIVPNRVRILLEMSRRIGGRAQAHADAFLAQIQTQF